MQMQQVFLLSRSALTETDNIDRNLNQWARRISTADVATQQKTINPYSQPCFTTYACNHSHGAGYYQYDHNMQIISADHGTGSSSYGSFRSHTTTASEFFEDSSSYSSTQSNEASSSNGSWYNAHLFTVGYLGH